MSETQTTQTNGVLTGTLEQLLADDPQFFDWRPHHVTMSRLKVTTRTPIQYEWLKDRTFGQYGHLQEWVERYAEALCRTVLGSLNELEELRAAWNRAEGRPNAAPEATHLHNELAGLRTVQQQLARGEFSLSPTVYEAVPFYEQQRAIALTACRSWCTVNGLPTLFDGIAILGALNALPGGDHLKWEQAACAPFLAPTPTIGMGPPTGEMAYSFCITGETQMPVNYGYPLPPAVFEEYARLCYRLVVRDQHPTYVKSDRYSPYSNVILAWYFQKGLSIGEISRKLGIAKSTAVRQLDYLIDLFNRDLPEGATPLKKRERD